jgi:hypothetical protein
MEKYLGTAYTIKELLSLLAEVPNNASTNLGGCHGLWLEFTRSLV